MGTFSGDTSPIPSFQRVLSACYHAEIDVQMQMIWDCGIRVAISIRDNWETRSFSRGDRDDEFESWDALWEAVVLWMLDYLHRDEPAGLAYTVSGDADQQNVDAEFICAMTNAADDLFAERAAMMSRIGKYREALGAIELALDEFADEGTPGYQPLSDGERMALEARRIVKKVLREPDCPTPEDAASGTGRGEKTP